MRLTEYLERQGESQAAFAERSGVPQQTINALCNGADARGSTWAKVALATNGLVQPADHYPIPSAAKGKRRAARGEA